MAGSWRRSDLKYKGFLLASMLVFAYMMPILGISTRRPFLASPHLDFINEPKFTSTLGYYILIGNLHTHTTYSDGRNTPLEMVLEARRNGFDFLAITDHNIIDGALRAREEVAQLGIHILLIIGEEVTYGWGHILALRINTLIFEAQLGPEEVIGKIHRVGGFAFLAHPTWGWNQSILSSLFDVGLIDGYEAYNKGFNVTPPLPKASYYPYIGSSDAHAAEELSITYTIVFSLNKTVEGVFDAILHKRVVIYWDGKLVGPNERLIAIIQEKPNILVAKREIGRLEALIINSRKEGLNTYESELALKQAFSQYEEGRLEEAIKTCMVERGRLENLLTQWMWMKTFRRMIGPAVIIIALTTLTLRKRIRKTIKSRLFKKSQNY